jgi:hypothetical protein
MGKAQQIMNFDPVISVLEKIASIEERLSGQILAIAQRPLVVNNERESYYEVQEDPLRGYGI